MGFDGGGFDRRQIPLTRKRLAGGRHPDEPKIISALKPLRSGLLAGQGQVEIPSWKSKYYNRFRPVLTTMIYVKIIYG
jgi:hypothetical protein